MQMVNLYYKLKYRTRHILPRNYAFNRSDNGNNTKQKGSEPELVAKTVLTAINTPNPNLRYLVGKDVEQ
jgi:hypothetical protein